MRDRAKDVFAGIIVVMVCMIAGSLLHKCHGGHGRQQEASEVVKSDTVCLTVHDTVSVTKPVAVSRVTVRVDTVTLGADTVLMYADAGIACDSARVVIPIEQKEYCDSAYRAWVSGYDVSLDSIRIYRRTEVVRIRDTLRAGRWHLGPALGWGMTPQGLQPYAGISLVYSVYSF